MNKKDILEIKRRFKKEACTFTRMCGCYVDADHNKITKIGETFLNLEDEEFYKYLEIAKKVLVRHDWKQSFRAWNFHLQRKLPAADSSF